MKSSTPNHQNHGKSEPAEKIIKTFLRKSIKTISNPYEALLDNISQDSSTSITAEIPMKATQFIPELKEQVLKEIARKTKKSKAYYDRTAKYLKG